MDVLVVEDEPLLREAVARDLREAGYRVGEAATAEAALATAGTAARLGVRGRKGIVNLVGYKARHRAAVRR